MLGFVNYLERNFNKSGIFYESPSKISLGLFKVRNMDFCCGYRGGGNLKIIRFIKNWMLHSS